MSLTRFYKAHVLPYAERSTPAIFHACPSTLRLIDDTQGQFLLAASISEEDALLQFNLAPLSTRRHLSMLTLLHHIRLGIAPSSLAELLPLAKSTILNFMPSSRSRHAYQFENRVGPGSPAIFTRSIFAMTGVYNDLPEWVVECKNANIFQKRCQTLIKDAAEQGRENWQTIFQPSC
jgi:hypothetical protein